MSVSQTFSCTFIPLPSQPVLIEGQHPLHPHHARRHTMANPILETCAGKDALQGQGLPRQLMSRRNIVPPTQTCKSFPITIDANTLPRRCCQESSRDRLISLPHAQTKASSPLWKQKPVCPFPGMSSPPNKKKRHYEYMYTRQR